MLHKLRNRFEQEQGFTLIELLVVWLLGPISSPQDQGSGRFGQSSPASPVPVTCETMLRASDYTACDTSAELGPTGLSYGNGAGQVQVDSGATTNGYSVTATSKSGNTFQITKDATTVALSRNCSTTAGSTSGGCSGSTW